MSALNLGIHFCHILFFTYIVGTYLQCQIQLKCTEIHCNYNSELHSFNYCRSSNTQNCLQNHFFNRNNNNNRNTHWFKDDGTRSAKMWTWFWPAKIRHPCSTLLATLWHESECSRWLNIYNIVQLEAKAKHEIFNCLSKWSSMLLKISSHHKFPPYPQKAHHQSWLMLKLLHCWLN